MSDSQSNESTVTYPLKVLTSANLQFLLNYIARDLGLTDIGKYKTTINGEWIHSDLEFESNGSTKIKNGQFPLNTFSTSNSFKKYQRSYLSLSDCVDNFIVYKNKIHFFGAYTGGYIEQHIHISGTPGNWKIRPPFPFVKGSYSKYYNKVVYNNKIHFIYNIEHFTFDGKKWERLEDNTYTISDRSSNIIVVYNNKIHIFNIYSNHHYIWDESGWKQEDETKVPYSSMANSAVVYNNKIYVIGYNNVNYFYSFDGHEWTQEEKLPVANYGSSLFVYNNKLNYVGTNLGKIYSWDGTEWTTGVVLPDLPVSQGSSSSALTSIFFNNNLYLFGYFNIGTEPTNPHFGEGYTHYYRFDETNHEWVSSFDDLYNNTVETKYKRI